jgi:predicted transcriptional regulator
VKFNELLVYDPGNQFPHASEIAPFAAVPSWWKGFIFHVLTARDLTVYLYLAMMTDGGNAVAYPLASSIQRDLNLASDSSVFSSIRRLDDRGFIRRQRSALPNRRSRQQRNVYQRTAPEFTLLTLLQGNPTVKNDTPKIDFLFRPIEGSHQTSRLERETYTAIPRDIRVGLEHLIGTEAADKFAYAHDIEKKQLLISALETRFKERTEKAFAKPPPQPAPKDHARERARERELEAASRASS